MELFLKPFYAYEDEGAPADSANDWQCAFLSFAVHAFFLSVAVFCMPLFACRHIDLPKEEIIMVTMESLPPGCVMASAVDAGAQSNVCDAAPRAAPPAPHPKTPETPKPVKRTVAAVKPKPVNITPPKPETLPENRPEPGPSPESMTQAAVAPENPPNDAGVSSADAESSGAGAGSSENGNHSGGGSPHGRGSGSGTGAGTGMGSGSGETAFGSAGGPGFIQRALPRFPRRAQVQGKEGTVVLRLTIDHEGHLAHVEIVSGAGNGFDEEAVRAIQKSTFSPAVRNGKPVTCLAVLSVKFQLKSDSGSHSD
jgi:periplasmic protein TonB